MRITLRIVLSLVLTATVVVGVSTFFQARHERASLLEDLQRRSSILADTLDDSLAPLIAAHEKAALKRLVKKYDVHGRLSGIAVYGPDNQPLAASASLAGRLDDFAKVEADSAKESSDLGRLQDRAAGQDYVFASPIDVGDGPVGTLVLVHDASFIGERIAATWRHTYFRLLFQTIILCLVCLWIVRWSIATPVRQLAEWMRELRAGTLDAGSFQAADRMFQPVAAEAEQLAKSLTAAREAAEQEARLRQRGASVWTAERLKENVKAKLAGGALFVVANREPYMHVRKGPKIDVITPASGLVTGLEPILRACGGLWLAHGAGDADRETADEKGKLAVPPGEPQYTLKRVWLTKEQEEGYYYGFANEGLWPLCHNVHARPMFKPKDWSHYQDVNRLFADALLEELEGVEHPYVLIQDYHFALLPALIKQARPDARVAQFWHIPWPNPEAFGICPWQREILQGMLGSDLLGFHTQFHCNNFLETVDRTLECRIDWERFAVQRRGHMTLVKPYPISVAFPPRAPEDDDPKPAVLKGLGLEAELLGIGVDRLDYTKGILERFLGIERFLEKYPDYVGRFTFVQIGAPSRTHIPRYRDLYEQIVSEAERINWKFKLKDRKYKAIALLTEHHNHEQITPYYRAADVCLVTSLHDGMNLVAKEFVAARSDERGVLILSRFTGAARELRDSLIVNPYDSEQMAEALRFALEMPEDEQVKRMKTMRQLVSENNVYAWAASLIDGLAALRPSAITQQLPAPAAAGPGPESTSRA